MSKQNTKHNYNLTVLRLIVASGLGIFIFFGPEIDGSAPFIYLSSKIFLAKVIGQYSDEIITIIPVLMLCGYTYAKTIAKDGSKIKKFFKEDGLFQLSLYILSTIFALCYYFKVGPQLLLSEHTGGVIIGNVLNYTISMIPIGSLVLPLLANYGLIEIIGYVLKPIMRPLFKLPGKAALDSIASIVGSAPVGILLTAKLYKQGEYSLKEAFAIATNFSLASVGYCFLILGIAGVSFNLGLLFVAYAILSYLIAAIIIRIPPICNLKDTYIDNMPKDAEERCQEKYSGEGNIAQRIFAVAVKKADESGSVTKQLAQGFIEGIKITCQALPCIMAIGTAGLMIAEFTPLLDWIAMPFVPLISLLGIPEASVAASAIIGGGIDMLLPVTLIVQAEAVEATKFFVALVSLVQVLYISETMLPIIFFGIPGKFSHILIVFFERTLIAMPFAALLTHILY